MNIQHYKTFMTTTTARLAGTYLAIIMLMSIGFSLVFYSTSYHQLDRQLPPSSISQFTPIGGLGPNGSGVFSPQITQYIQQRITEGQTVLKERLILLNIGALCVGGILSYFLARRTLRPIEEAMDAQSQFVSDASHELRTPLTAMQTSNEVALRKSNLTLREAKKLIEQDTQDIRRLNDLSDALLSLASQQNARLTVKPVALQDIASEAMTLVVRQATEKDITIEDQVANLSTLGDQKSLVQLLVILLDNAVKYSHKNGTVYLSSYKKDNHVYVAVRDEGVGIRAADIQYVFQRFYRADSARTHNRHGGYGLGLSIAERIAANHHGVIIAQSKLGEGSTFTVKLPSA